jgi:hypothetical protein
MLRKQFRLGKISELKKQFRLGRISELRKQSRDREHF